MNSQALLAIVVLAVLGFAGLVAVQISDVIAARQAAFATTTKNNLESMFVFVDPAQLFKLSIALVVVVPLVVWLLFRNPVLAAGAAIAAWLAPRWAINRVRTKRLAEFERQLPDALLMVVGGLRAGASLNIAMESMVREARPPLSQEFDLLIREQRIGVDLDTALLHMDERLPIADFRMVTAGLRISREVGGNLADILDTLARTLREKQIMEGKITSLTAQGRMQGIVMTCLPLFLMGVLYLMDEESMGPLFTTPLGWGVLSVIAVMEVMGYFAINAIVNIDV